MLWTFPLCTPPALPQRDFNASRCPSCGMVYARGQEDDEKLHRSYCAAGSQGVKFQVRGAGLASALCWREPFGKPLKISVAAGHPPLMQAARRRMIPRTLHGALGNASSRPRLLLCRGGRASASCCLTRSRDAC